MYLDGYKRKAISPWFAGRRGLLSGPAAMQLVGTLFICYTVLQPAIPQGEFPITWKSSYRQQEEKSWQK